MEPREHGKSGDRGLCRQAIAEQRQHRERDPVASELPPEPATAAGLLSCPLRPYGVAGPAGAGLSAMAFQKACQAGQNIGVPSKRASTTVRPPEFTQRRVDSRQTQHKSIIRRGELKVSQ